MYSFVLVWQLWFFFLASTNKAYVVADEELCSVCACKENMTDCSYLSLKVLPKVDNINKSVSKISFEGNYISHITKFQKHDAITYLILSHNHIISIDDSAFQNLPNLVILDLSYNYLTMDRLMPNIFRGNYAPDRYEPLRNLKTLILNGNLLHALHMNVFEHIPYLESVSLSHNPLKVIDYGTIQALSSIPYLKTLNLSNTQLTKFQENVLHAPKFLEILDLSLNYFKEPPMELEHTHTIKWLSLNENPIKYIKKFPSLPYLRVLHLSKMKELHKIESRSLSTLPMLKEFYCSDNSHFMEIDGSAFSAVNENEEGEIWPPLQVLEVNNNQLQYLDSHLVGRWDKLLKISLENNSFVCDCENQWLVSVLLPLIKKINPQSLTSLKCTNPIEMQGLLLDDLYKRHYHMRCLDTYNHRPENDGMLLIYIFFAVLITIPLIMMAIIYCNRYRNSNRYQRALFSPLQEFM